MRNVVSGLTYFLVGGSVLLIILIIIVTFNSQIFDFSPPEIEPTSAKVSETEEPSEINPEPEPTSGFEVPSLNQNVRIEDAVFYEGDLELPINGATGYAAVPLDVYNAEFELILAVLNPGDAFVIMRESGTWWQVNIGNGSIIGWVRHNHCMINLPDVIPSMIYNNTNAYSSVFRANDVYIPNVTDEQLYSYSSRRDGKAWNERLQRYEYIVPVLYSTAKRTYQAQLNAVAGGDVIIMYEAFRPRSVQDLVYTEVSKLANSNADVRRGFGSWNMSWFIAGGRSNHQVGYAIDISLGKIVTTDYMVSGKYKYPKYDYFEYEMPSPIHELSTQGIVYTHAGGSAFSEAFANNEYAQTLQKYCMDAGFSPLPSEWWHFNDEHTNAALTKESDGRYEITACLSVAPG